MYKYFGIALMMSVLLVQLQLKVRAQASDQLELQTPQLQPAMSPALDTNLRGPIGGQATTQPSPLPFSTSSPYSYSEPAKNGTAANSSFDNQPTVTAPTPTTGSGKVTSVPSKSTKQKRHGFSPVGAVLGVPDRAVKSSFGLTDRSAKAGLGVTGKTTKELLKAVF